MPPQPLHPTSQLFELPLRFIELVPRTFARAAAIEDCVEWVDRGSIVRTLGVRAKEQPNEVAYTFIALSGGRRALGHAELDASARAFAVQLRDTMQVGERALLLLDFGPDFLVAFLGCLYAGVVAVPAFAPAGNLQRWRRLTAIVRNCDATVVITHPDRLDVARAWTTEEGLTVELLTPSHLDLARATEYEHFDPRPETLAFLQYTSGSTGTPKGVMVTHGNLEHNCLAIRDGFELVPGDAWFSWLPHFHDMGLIGGLLTPLFSGIPSYSISPLHFLRDPLGWLKLIDETRCTVSGAPNFAYGLCVEALERKRQPPDLDLSRLKVAFNGAEPVRAQTLAAFSKAFAPYGFDERAFYPCYGLAEATLFVTGGSVQAPAVTRSLDAAALERDEASAALEGRDAVTVVGCGTPRDHRLRVIDPATARELPEGAVGELWVHSPSVAAGYWQRERDTVETFRARIANTLSGEPDEHDYLRTADLGFVRDHEVFVTGRLKELIIIDGRNHYPQDIEATVSNLDPNCVGGACIAFGVERDGRDAVVVATELRKRPSTAAEHRALETAVRKAVLEEHGVGVLELVLVPRRRIPKTTSGKLARRLCRQQYLDGSIERIAPPPGGDELPSAAPRDTLAERITERIAARIGLEPSSLDPRAPLTGLGLDSKSMVSLAMELAELTGRDLPATLLFDHGTLETLIAHLEDSSPKPRARSKRTGTSEVAIVGAALRLPGGVSSLPELWAALASGADLVGEPPSDRRSMFADAPAAPWMGGWLGRDDLECFDAELFSISAREAAEMDPQQRLLLALSWEALERAGMPLDTLRESATGVFVGLSSHDYERGRLGATRDLEVHTATGVAASAAAGRISFALGLRGPSMVVDTACSSSLVALHLASRSVALGESDRAIAGGVNVILSSHASHAMGRLSTLSPTGRCRTFDAQADGYVRSEGAVVLVLERLETAVANGDPILGVICGSAVGHDGPAAGLTAPSGPAQSELVERALAEAGLTPDDVSYLEAHGTGTSLGDPIEVHALEAVFGRRRHPEPVWIGSVKAHLGHLEAAAGLAGVAKVLAAMGEGLLPAQAHLRTLNPKIRFEALRVCDELRAWDRGPSGRRIAGTSSFGITGTNAHVLISEPPTVEISTTPGRPLVPLLPLCAPRADALPDLARAHRDALGDRDTIPAELLAGAATRRTHHPHRLVIDCRDGRRAREALDAIAGGRAHEAAWTREGSTRVLRWQGFFGDLPPNDLRRAVARAMEDDALLREHIESVDAELRSVGGPSPVQGLASERDDEPSLAALTLAGGVAWARLLRTSGVRLSSVTGRGRGVWPALVAAQCLSVREVARLLAADEQGRPRPSPLIVKDPSTRLSLNGREIRAGSLDADVLGDTSDRKEHPPESSLSVLSWGAPPEGWPPGLRLDEAEPSSVLARVYVAGADLNWSALFEGVRADVNLPLTPVHPQRFELRDFTQSGGPRGSVLALAATDRSSLSRAAIGWARRLESAPRPADVCFTANQTAQGEHRLALVVDDAREAAHTLQTFATGASEGQLVAGIAESDRKLAFLFTGAGAQRPGMGRMLDTVHPVYAHALDRCATILEYHLDRPLREILYGDDEAIHRLDYAQPALFCVEYALSELWASLGVRPGAVFGHSTGEIVAACVAGVLSLEEALPFIADRAALMQSMPAAGGLVALRGIVVDEVVAWVADHAEAASIASYNGPHSVVVSGSSVVLDALVRHFEPGGADARRVAVSAPAHSPFTESILDAYEARVRSLTLRSATIPVATNVTGALSTEALARPDYWRQHMRQPVRFHTAIETLLGAGFDTFVEVGPHPTLCTMAKDGRDDSNERSIWVPSLHREHDDWSAFRQALARLHVAGVDIDWAALDAPFSRTIVAMPDTSSVNEAVGRMPFSGRRVDLPGDATHFARTVGLGHDPYLTDHRVEGRLIAPGALSLALVLSTLEEEAGPSILEDVVWTELLELDEEQRLNTTLKRNARGFEIDLSSSGSSGWRSLLRANARPLLDDRGRVLDRGAFALRCHEAREPRDLYAANLRRGVDYGPTFRWIESLTLGDGEALARLERPSDTSRVDAPIHPAMLDAVFQVATVWLEDEGPWLPFSLERVRCFGWVPDAAHVRAVRRSHDTDGLRADFEVFDDDGNLLVQLEGLCVRRLVPRSIPTYALAWVETPTSDPHAPVSSRPRILWGAPLPPEFVEPVATIDAPESVESLDAAIDQLVAWTTEHPDREVVCHWPGVPALTGSIALARLLARTKADVLVLTRGAVAVDPGEEPITPDAAALWGVGRVAQQELRDRTLRLVDLDPAAHEFDLSQALIDSPSGDALSTAWRGERRLVPRLRPASNSPGPDPVPDPFRPDPDAVYVLTGGLGAIGSRIAARLVTGGARHLVLTSRRPHPASWPEPLANALSRSEATIEVVDLEANALLQAIGPRPLGGIVHAAGVLEDATLEAISPDIFERVAAPKIGGARALDVVLKAHATGWMVALSSFAATIGSPGQAAYAAANAYLDAWVAMWAARGRRAVSVAYGPWAGAGMFARLDASARRRVEQTGLRPLDPAAALTCFDAALTAEEIWLAPVDLEPVALSRSLPQTALLAELQNGKPPGDVELSPTVRRLLRTRGSARVHATREWVASRAGEVLGTPPDQIAVDVPLRSLGMDSLMAVEFRTRLARDLGDALPATLVFEHPTLEALSAYVQERLEARPRPAATPVSATTSDAHSNAQPDEPIAIVGISCRFPGGADSPAAFWRNLIEGVDAVGEVPASRWDIDAYYDPNPDAVGKTYTRQGAFLTQVDGFDAEFFGISPREASLLDPQQRLLLETSWEALEDAAIAPSSLKGSRSGVFVGLPFNDYARLCEPLLAEDPYAGMGTSSSFAVGRIAYTLGFQGPAVAVDTACSSSLVGLHLAARALQGGECDVALAGGATLMLSPDTTVYFSRLRALAPDGRSKAFAASADGYGRGEGCAMLVLKRLCDAQADGDRIWAVVRGSAVGQDGRSNGLTSPHAGAQRQVIEQALARAKVAPHEVDYVEAHGTGTRLGDPIEVEALTHVFGDRRDGAPLQIGSVKTNIGHTEGAAGVAGVLKVILGMHHQRLPATLHFDEPNPHIPWSDIPVSVVDTPTAWNAGARPRIAGVSSFGMSGTNAHVVLAEPPPREAVSSASGPNLLVVSARTDAALRRSAEALATALSDLAPERLGGVARTLQVGRDHWAHRAAVVCDGDPARAAEAFRAFAQGRPDTPAYEGVASSRRLLWLFSGQGAQAPGMGRELDDRHPAYRAALDECSAAWRGETSLRDIIYGSDEETLAQTELAQPALFAHEYALARTWQALGVEPAALLGHSIGEWVAATLAGVFHVEDAMRLVGLRGRLMQSIRTPGAMLAIDADEDTARQWLTERGSSLDIAAINGPSAVVLSGDEAAIACAEAHWHSAGCRPKRLRVSHAFHSAHFDPILEPFATEVARVERREPSLELLSNVTGRYETAAFVDPEYWSRQLRAPVRFVDAVIAALDAGCDTTLELGPHPVSSPNVAPLLAGPERALATARRGADGWETLCDAVARAYTLGVDIDWSGFVPDHPRDPRDLPTYPWQRCSFWVEERRVDAANRPEHPLVGPMLELASTPVSYVCDGSLDLERLSYLRDHNLRGTPLFPTSGYVEMLATLAARLELRDPVLESLRFDEGMMLSAQPRRVQLQVTPAGSGHRVIVRSREGDAPWTVHMHGHLRAGSAPLEPAEVDPSTLRARCANTLDRDAHYARMAAVGFPYGPAFRGVQELRLGDGEAFGRVELPEDAGPRASHRYHPALLDAAFQILAAALLGSDDEPSAMYVPVGLERFVPRRPAGTQLWVHATVEERTEGRGRGHATFFDEEGRVLATAEGFEAERLSLTSGTRERYVTVQWSAAPGEPRRSAPQSWILLAPVGESIAPLAAALQSSGHRVVCADASEPVEAVLARHGSEQAPDHVVHLRALGRDDAAQRTHLSALRLVKALLEAPWRDKPRLWWVTRGCQAPHGQLVDPIAATLWGLGRTLAYEHPELPCTRVDLDPTDPDGGWGALARELLRARDADDVALSGEQRWVATLGPQRITEEDERIEPARGRPHRLEVDNPGNLSSLCLRSFETPDPGPQDVVIAVEAASLNFIDIAKSMGIYPGLDHGPYPLGGECSGRVRAVGANVDHVAIGDPVIAIASASQASHVVAPAAYVARRPDTLDAERAAAVPLVYMTAWYGLRELARLQPGEKILIHAATGGTGLAAISIAKGLGAEIFATAGSEAKRAHLRSLGIEHVMDSRSFDFVEQIARTTRGEGVDVVLNSLAARGIEESLSVLAEDGRFLELGKRDIHDPGRSLPMSVFARRISFHAIDLEGMAERRPTRFATLFREVVTAFERGELEAPPVTSYPLSKAEDAYRFMAQAKHIGKLVLQPDEHESWVRVRGRPSIVRPDRSYLITGGTGALGLETARWLAGMGAGKLVLCSRSTRVAPNGEAVLEALREAGTSVELRACDVTDARAVDELVRSLASDTRPLAGIVHAAGVLRDGLCSEATEADFEAVLAPKLAGAEHLDRATADLDLDLFVLYGSVAGLFGSPGQANYAAANAALHAFAHRRHAQGRPCTIIDWGPFEDLGYAANTRGRLTARGMFPFTSEQGRLRFEQILGAGSVVAGPVEVDFKAWLRTYPQVAASPLLAGLAGGDSSGADSVDRGLLDEVRRLPAGKRKARLATAIAQAIASVMRIEPGRIRPDTPLEELGLDSLMGLELANRLGSMLGLELSATTLWNFPTPGELAGHLEEQLGLRDTPRAAQHDAASATPPAPPRPDATPDAQGQPGEDDDDARLLAKMASLSALLDG